MIFLILSLVFTPIDFDIKKFKSDPFSFFIENNCLPDVDSYVNDEERVSAIFCKNIFSIVHIHKPTSGLSLFAFNKIKIKTKVFINKIFKSNRKLKTSGQWKKVKTIIENDKHIDILMWEEVW